MDDFVSRLTHRQTTKSSILGENADIRNTKWWQADQTTGTFICKVDKECCWEANGPARAVFRRLAPDIKNHLDQSLEPIAKWVTWHMYMFGSNPRTATPTVLFCCEVAAHRKQIRNAIKDSGLLDRYPGLKSAHMARPPDLGTHQQLVQLGTSPPRGTPEHKAKNAKAFASLGNKAPGMEIFVVKGRVLEDGWARRATIGGVVRLGTKFFYTTVAHAFQGWAETNNQGSFWPESSESPDDEFEIDGDSDDECGEEQMSDSGTPTLAQPVRADRNGTGCQTTTGTDPDRESSHQSHLVSMDEVTAQQRDLGRLITGLRTHQLDYLGIPSLSSMRGPNGGLDYSFIEVMDPRHKTSNKTRNSAVGGSGATVVTSTQVVASGPIDTDILCLTSRGCMPGRLSGTPLYGRAPGGGSFQEMLSIRLETPLEYGDCGSWVVDADTGDLFGHIVGGSHGSCTAILIPFIDVFEDVQRKCGQMPWMPTKTRPGSLVSSALATPATNSVSIEVQSANQPSEGQLSETENAWIQSLTREFEKLLLWKRGGQLETQKQLRAFNSGLSTYVDPDESLPPYTSTDAPQGPPSRRSGPQGRPMFPLIPTAPDSSDKESLRFRNRLIKMARVPCEYENPGLLDEALQVVPLNKIYREAEEESNILQKTAHSLGNDARPAWGYMDCVLRALLRWFKRSFFAWVNNPPCPVCLSPTTAMGMTPPMPDERACEAHQVELYRCSNAECQAFERFPRYANVWRLLETRRGRVGEWANCFAMLCRAVGANVRWIWGSEDHVWVEVYSEHHRRWVHVDPCEEAWDKPGMYTEGWGKALAYCIAFSVEGATDVTRRYVRNSEHLKARSKCPEPVLLYILQEITQLRQRTCSESEKAEFRARYDREQKELSAIIASRVAASLISGIAASDMNGGTGNGSSDGGGTGPGVKMDGDRAVQEGASGNTEWTRSRDETRWAQ